MSLATDSIFVEALNSNSELVEAVGGRIYGTAIPLPDEEMDNAPVPYLVVTFDGLNNGAESKDEAYEGEQDTVTIGVAVTAPTLEALHNLTQAVRGTIAAYFQEGDTEVEDYQFSANAIQYDALKPCYWQQLVWVCSVPNDFYYYGSD